MSKVLEVIKNDYLKEHKNATIDITYISSGVGFAQIQNGADVDVFVSADTNYPKRLFEAGLSNEPKIYAKGALALFSTAYKITSLDDLNKNYKHIAIANPDLAPYGRAAVEVLKKLDLYEKYKDKLVQAPNISKANQWILLKSADIGFSALSLIDQDKQKGHFIKISSDLYSPINQAFVILNKSKSKEDAKDFMNFVLKQGDTFQAFGYEMP